MKKLLNNYRGLPKEIYVLCFAQFINRLGEFVVPFLALYLTQKMGMSAASSGIIVTISSIISIPAAIAGGRVSDMCGRKKVYIYAQTIAAIALIPCAFTNSVAISVLCLLISTFFNGFVRPAFESMITDLLPNKQRQAGFSLKYLSINMGVSVGPILAGFLFNNLLPMLFIGDALTSLLAVLLICLNVRETHPAGKTVKVESKAERTEKGNILELFYKRPQLLAFFMIFFLYSFIYTQHRFALPISLNTKFNHQGANLFGYLMSINAVTVVVLTIFISTFTKKNHQLMNMVLAGIFYAVGFGMLAFSNTFILFVISTIIWTIGEILSSISSGVYVANNCPNNYRARLSAVNSVVYSLGASLSTAVSGFFIQLSGCKTIWIFIFFLSMLAVFFMFCLYRYAIKVKEKQYVTI